MQVVDNADNGRQVIHLTILKCMASKAYPHWFQVLGVGVFCLISATQTACLLNVLEFLNTIDNCPLLNGMEINLGSKLSHKSYGTTLYNCLPF